MWPTSSVACSPGLGDPLQKYVKAMKAALAQGAREQGPASPAGIELGNLVKDLVRARQACSGKGICTIKITQGNSVNF